MELLDVMIDAPGSEEVSKFRYFNTI